MNFGRGDGAPAVGERNVRLELGSRGELRIDSGPLGRSVMPASLLVIPFLGPHNR